MKNKFILFDFDGVIVDSFAAAYAVAKTICPHLTERDYGKRFEGNIHERQEEAELHTAECRHDIDFFAAYGQKMRSDVLVFPKMKKIVMELAREYTLVIISSTMTRFIQEFLEFQDLLSCFSSILGADVHTSKVEKIKMVFAKYGLKADQCVFVTDTLGDLREAAKADVGAVAVAWGFNDSETLRRGKPFRLIQTPEELSATIADYFAAPPKEA